MYNKIIIGSRASRLAIWQAEKVKNEIEKKYPALNVEIKKIFTSGDKIMDKSLVGFGGKGIFTREIENSLLSGEIDFAVHSLKDLPTELPEGLALCGVIERDFVEDVLIANDKGILISDIKSGGIIATGSVRRRAQLLHIRNDLNFVDLRGNIETRFDKFYKSNWEGMILARAGVERLGLSDKISSIIPVNQMLPAACQGIIGIESRAESQFAIEIANAINDQKTYIEATAERAFLKAISGGCSNPIAAFAKIDGVCLKLEIMIASINGRFLYRDAVSGDRENPENLGRILADKVLNSGVLWTQE